MLGLISGQLFATKSLGFNNRGNLRLNQRLTPRFQSANFYTINFTGLLKQSEKQ